MRRHHVGLQIALVIGLSACGGNTVEAPIATQPLPVLGAGSGKPLVGGGGSGGQEILGTHIETKMEASEFLRRAGLGGTTASIDALTSGSAVQWTQRQLEMPPRGYRAELIARLPEEDTKLPQVSQLIYETMIGSEAELRTRATYALSQIFVVNGEDFFNHGRGLGEWMDLLDRHAFGNYRDLMGDVSRSPIMGQYLTFLFNKKADEQTGREPDENYARELLQLFTIGLVELNMDATPRLGSDGQPIDTYTNDDVVGLARVFTGYRLAGSSHRWRDRYEDAWERPMQMYERDHSDREKRFLGSVIAANTQGEASVEQALDIIFDHPNVAPFVSRQLIQRFTASDPDPRYVERVAVAFETGRFAAEDGTQFGTGRRGDLAATFAAIILDPALHDDVTSESEGKVREPVLNFVQMARRYKSTEPNLVTTDWSSFADTSDVSKRLGQSPLRSPSVFNFYRPGYVAPGTESGEAGMTAPELQIVNEASTVGYMNYMYEFITREEGDFVVMPDFSAEVALAHDPDALIDRLDLDLTAGTMTDATRESLREMMDSLPIRSNDEARDRLSRVRLAMMMVVVSPEYMTLN